MQEPLQIGYRDVAPSAAVERAIRERAERLDTFYDRITRCRVVVEAPHRRQHRGRRFHVRVELTVPGRVIVVTRDPKAHQEYEDVYVAIRDAFDATTRQLEDYVRESRGFTKAHEAPPEGRIARLVPTAGYGFIETADGREIYFHRNAVLDHPFERLEVGMPVRFAEEIGTRGPQASSVHPRGRSQRRPSAD
jgi:cold shock CspA family protein/ribosome-associated translation inhibitor RaiA